MKDKVAIFMAGVLFTNTAGNAWAAVNGDLDRATDFQVNVPMPVNTSSATADLAGSFTVKNAVLDHQEFEAPGPEWQKTGLPWRVERDSVSLLIVHPREMDETD